MLDYPMFTPKDYQDPVNHYVYGLLRHYHFSEKRSLKLVHNENRDNARTPMQWNTTKNAGFSTSEKTWLPVNPNYEKINAETEENDDTSILNYYKKLIALRKENPALLFGDFEPLKTKGSIMAYYRGYEGEMVFVLLNLTKKVQSLPRKISTMIGDVLLSNYPHAGLTYKKRLRPYEALIVKVK